MTFWAVGSADALKNPEAIVHCKAAGGCGREYGAQSQDISYSGVHPLKS